MAERYPDVEDVVDVIANGQRAMPAFDARLSDEEIQAVARFVRDEL